MSGEFLELVLGGDKTLQARVMQRVQKIILDSYLEDRSRPTQDETRRRFKLIETMMRELRSEHGWAWERILDAMPIALRCRLDGLFWDPKLSRNSWSTGRAKL